MPAPRIPKHAESLEIERKYDVQDRETLPSPADFARIGLSLDAAETHDLEARYFDTATGLLASHRMAVRRRSGGKDAGWHLKVRGDEGVHELQWPLSSEPPEGLLAELEHRLGEKFGGTELAAIATMRTVRTTTIVRGSSRDAIVELADDTVDATNHRRGGRAQWREWEAELLPGADSAELDRIEPLLLNAGATPALGTSKIQRTMSLEPPGETP